MKKKVLQKRDVILGRILKNQGRFDEALPYFQKLFSALSDEEYQISSGWQMVLFSNIADLYCEVGDPRSAEAVLEKELQIVYKRGWGNIACGRRLQLAIIESFIRRGSFSKAEEDLNRLIPIFESVAEPDMIQMTGYFRVWAGLARISHLQRHWDDALIRWYRAWKVVEVAGWTAGSIHGIILCSVAKVLAAQAATAQVEKTKLNLAEEAKI